MSKLIIILICLLVSLNAHAEPVGLSCYYDTGVTEINGTPTNQEHENKTFGMMLDIELEWFWRFPPEALVDENINYKTFFVGLHPALHMHILPYPIVVERIPRHEHPHNNLTKTHNLV